MAGKPFTIPGKNRDGTARPFGGVNRALEPGQLPDHQAEWAMNLYEERPGELATRPNTSLLKSFELGTLFVADGLLIPFRDRLGTKWYILWTIGSPTYPGEGVFHVLREDFSASTVDLASLFVILHTTSTERPGFIHYNRKLYVFPGSNAACYVIDTDGSTLNASAMTGEWAADSNFIGLVGWLYLDSFIVAGYAGAEESTFRFTNVTEPETLLPADKSDYVGRGDGDRIIHGMEIPVKGGANYVESYSVVWKRNSTWILSGLPPTSALDGDIRVVPLIPKEGLIAKETVVTTPMGVVWCSGSNVWILPTNSVQPLAVGNAISPMLEAMARSDPGAWHASYYKGFYRLSVPAQVSLVHNATEAAADVTQTEQWWLDLRSLPEEVKWWGPMTRPAWSSALDYLEDGTPRLLECCTVTNDTGNFLLIMEGDVATEGHADGYYSSLGAGGMPMEFRGKEFDFGDALSEKLIEKMEIAAFADREATLEVKMVGDGGDLASSTEGGLTVEMAGFVLGTSLLDTGRLGKKFSTLVGYPPEGGRFRAKTWQPVVSYTPTDVDGGREIRIKAIGAMVRPMGRRNR